MGLWEWLGLRPAAGPPPAEGSEAVSRIARALADFPTDRARWLAAFAYLLGRVACADHELSRDELTTMEAIVCREGGLPREQARVVVELAVTQSRLHGGTEDFDVAREFATLATAEDKRALLACLFAVSASDESVVTSEDNEIRRITRELRIPHEDFVAARARVRGQLAVLHRREEGG